MLTVLAVYNSLIKRISQRYRFLQIALP